MRENRIVLKKSVCKKCRIKELGKEGWNYFAEAWFKPNEIRDGQAQCPYTIFNRMADHMKELVHKYGTPAERYLMDKVIFIQNRQGSYPHPVHQTPPVWCPYKKEHVK